MVRQKRQVKGAEELRRARAKRLATIFVVVVLLPTLVATVYYGFMASGQYRASITLTLETGVAATGSGKNSSAQKDVATLRAMLRSRAAYDRLVADAGLRDHYGDSGVDRFSRLSTEAGGDDGHAYFLDHLEFVRASDSALEVGVFGFDPAATQSLAQGLVKHLEVALAAESKARHEALVAPAEAKLDALRAAPGDGVEAEVAKRRLAAALRAVELAEAEALRRQPRLVVVSAPSLPDATVRPRRLWNIATVFFTALALGGLVLLLGDVVREHAQF